MARQVDVRVRENRKFCLDFGRVFLAEPLRRKEERGFQGFQTLRIPDTQQTVGGLWVSGSRVVSGSPEVLKH